NLRSSLLVAAMPSLAVIMKRQTFPSPDMCRPALPCGIALERSDQGETDNSRPETSHANKRWTELPSGNVKETSLARTTSRIFNQEPTASCRPRLPPWTHRIQIIVTMLAMATVVAISCQVCLFIVLY